MRNSIENLQSNFRTNRHYGYNYSIASFEYLTKTYKSDSDWNASCSSRIHMNINETYIQSLSPLKRVRNNFKSFSHCWDMLLSSFRENCFKEFSDFSEYLSTKLCLRRQLLKFSKLLWTRQEDESWLIAGKVLDGKY